ncbi:hypothetical protein GCM10027345_06220 [Hymenobacter daeguensis]
MPGGGAKLASAAPGRGVVEASKTRGVALHQDSRPRRRPEWRWLFGSLLLQKTGPAGSQTIRAGPDFQLRASPDAGPEK